MNCRFSSLADEQANSLMAQYTKRCFFIGLKTSKPSVYITASHFRVATLKWLFLRIR
ncbi:hypothetical protein JCM19240_1489 [Vibrio maritimus]|uniref:Uncharacterized protein n=1 Tax=Vibrio maritimus TaxID=990268 RepID=A0A090TYX1_9VIBR|nr:hypothetical protein JCM19240_1489 [Vibrio maritimus]